MGKPKIRFKGFDDDWEQRKLGDVLERRIEQRQQSKEYPRLAFASGQGVIPLSERKTNNREQLTKDEYTKKYLVTELNDIVYNPANVKYGAIDRNKCGRGLISPIYVTFTTSEISGFIERIVTSHDFQQRALRFEEGTVTKRQSVNPEDLVTLDILVASKREEQQKIATYFDSLDNLITLHQRKCEETKSLKKYMLQKMFPENGKCVPKIRFSGFSDAWEQRKFGDLYCKVSEKNDLSFGSDKIISVANMYFKEDVKDSSEEYMRTYNVMRLGDIAFEGNKSKNYAHGRFVENTIGDGIVSHVFDVFRPIAEYDLYFWKYLINNEDVMGRIMTRCTKASTMMTNLVTNDFLKEEIMVPSLDEQRKIGKYLDDLDNLITLHQHKCDELQKLKKFMLQNMFVQQFYNDF